MEHQVERDNKVMKVKHLTQVYGTVSQNMTVVSISSFLCLRFYLHRCKFKQANPNFVAFLKLVKIKRNTEYKIAESNGKLRQHFKKWTLDLEAP